MPLSIGSGNIYVNIGGNKPEIKKFQNVWFGHAGTALYTETSGMGTAYTWSLLVSASASGNGDGTSAGGMDSLRASYQSGTALYVITPWAQSGSAWFREMKLKEVLSPTQYLVEVGLEIVPNSLTGAASLAFSASGNSMYIPLVFG